MRRWHTAWLSLLLPFTCAVALAKPTAPEWVTEVVAKPASLEYKKAAVAILLDEQLTEVGIDGTFTHRTRHVMRVLTADGRAEAKAMLYYNTDTCRIKSFRAWIIRPKGDVLTYEKDKIVDAATYSTARELYGEGRRQVLSADLDAEEGSVFAYERNWEEKSMSSQSIWSFAERFPVECSRLIVRLAAGWTVETRMFNHDPVQPSVAGNTMTWEMRQLSPARREPFAPIAMATQPYLALNYQPPANAKGVCRRPLFTWQAISSYFTPLYDQAAAPNNELKAKADALATGAGNLTEKIGALCQYVQNTSYISILLNSAEGGGSIPQPAGKIFRCNYGDCKDKTTLLRSMLRTQGIDSFPLLVYAGDYRRLNHDWPAMWQFNHCILAIKIDPTIDGPALIVHPKHGRLMIFDPTNPYVPFGTLSKSDSGGSGLLLAGSEGEFLQLPAIQPSVQQQTITARLLADGSLVGTLYRRMSGPGADQARAEFRSFSTLDFNRRIKGLVQQALPLSELNQIEPVDDFSHDAFALKVNFSVRGYGKTMRDVLLVFKPVVFPGNAPLPVVRAKRTLPVVVAPLERTETIEITLPEGFSIDELPRDVNLKSSIGTYTSAVHKGENGSLNLVRTLRLSESTVPPAGYAEICQFAEQILEAEQAPVVLRHN